MSEDQKTPAGTRVDRLLTPERIAEAATINPGDLDTAFVELSSLVAHFGAEHAKALRQVDRMKHRLEVIEAATAKELREEFGRTGEKVTEARLGQEITLNKKVIAARSAYIDAKEVSETVRAACEALRHKRDMLIQIGVDRRDEKRGELRLNEIGASERAAKASISDRARRAAGVSAE